MSPKKSDDWAVRKLPPELENYVDNGPGQDSKIKETREPEPQTTHTFVMSAGLHRKFKLKCVAEGTKMRTEMIRMIEAWVGD